MKCWYMVLCVQKCEQTDIEFYTHKYSTEQPPTVTRLCTANHNFIHEHVSVTLTAGPASYDLAEYLYTGLFFIVSRSLYHRSHTVKRH